MATRPELMASTRTATPRLCLQAAPPSPTTISSTQTTTPIALATNSTTWMPTKYSWRSASATAWPRRQLSRPLLPIPCRSPLQLSQYTHLRSPPTRDQRPRRLVIKKTVTSDTKKSSTTDPTRPALQLARLRDSTATTCPHRCRCRTPNRRRPYRPSLRHLLLIKPVRLPITAMSSYFPARKCWSFSLTKLWLKFIWASSSPSFLSGVALFSDKFKLTSSVNMNVVNISPNESIKYAKETQTTEVPSKHSHHLNDDDDSDQHAERNENSFQEDLKKSELPARCT